MTRISRSALALGAVFFALVISGCGDSVPSGSIAKVDNLTIAKSTYDRWFKTASTSQPGAVAPDPPTFTKCVAAKVKAAGEPPKGQPKPKTSDYVKQCKQEYDQLKQQVITFLIRSTWLEAEGRKLGVTVSDKESAAAFDKARKQAFPKTADYVKFLKTSGQTEADLVYRQAVQLLEQKITEKVQASAKKVTDKDIENYYVKNKDKQFTQPAARDLLVVLTQTKTRALEAKRALEAGDSWVRVVKDYSTDPTTKDADGVLPNYQEGTGNNDFERAIFSAKKGDISGPVKATEGYYVFEVTKSSVRKESKLKDVKNSIRSILFQQRRQAALAKFGVDYQDHWKSKTECRGGYVSPDCSNAKTQRNSTVPPGAIPQGNPNGTTGPEGAAPVDGQGGQPQVPQQTTP